MGMRRKVNTICSLESQRLLIDIHGFERLSRLRFGAALWSGLWIGETLCIPAMGLSIHRCSARCMQTPRHCLKLLCDMHRLLHNQSSSLSLHLTVYPFRSNLCGAESIK